MENRSFYHSFPRGRPGEDSQKALKRALSVLEAIKRVGLILAPEVVEWRIPLADETTKHVKYRQTRICFTELSRLELSNHGKKFGPISLEFSIETLRELGALPAIYMPQMVGDDRHLSSAGPMLVWMFEMIRYTLDQLEQLSKLSDPQYALEFGRQQFPGATHVSENYTINLQNHNEDKVVDQQFEVEARTVRGILNYLAYKNAPFGLMRGAIHAAQSLFYPTDDHLHDELLSYYRQREWRVIPGFATGGIEQARRLESSEKEMLLKIDGQFWSKVLSDDKGVFQRIDEAYVIDKFNGKPIESLIRAVLVPPDILDPASALFEGRVSTIIEQSV